MEAVAVDDGLLRALRDPLVWEPRTFKGFDAIRRALEIVQAEDDAAELVLSGPPTSWPERIRKTPGTRTAGMVRQLLRRMPALLERNPSDALQATSIAHTISDALDPRSTGPITSCSRAHRPWASTSTCCPCSANTPRR